MSSQSSRSLVGPVARSREAAAALGRPFPGYAATVGAVTLAALAGRLLFLGHQPLWRDEAFTAVVVQRPLGPML
ncbi:MAG TPA: hypothetical protein VLO10_01200, partial [Candidatus Deferrimicrobium sp.]|nr:hypothetical protein [Candidatus Deferrimicrobium sp.]